MNGSGRKVGSEGGALHVLDGATMTVRGTVPVGSESFTIREAPDGASVCVANGASNTVSVVDLATLTVTRTLNIPPSRDFPFSGTHGLSFVARPVGCKEACREEARPTPHQSHGALPGDRRRAERH